MDFENTRLRAACITTYQVDQIDSMDWDRILKTTPVTYVIAGKEVCPETGKIHYQMYMEFDRKVTVRQIKRILRDTAAHIEPRYGTADEAKLYCKKDGLWWEKGRSKIQGERNDLKDVYEGLKVGKSLLEIIEDHPGTFIRYFKGIERTLDIIRRDQQRREERISPTVIVYIGKSGTGKSHRCYNDPDYQASGYKYPCQQTGKVYFDGYDGESVIWFDEFGGSVLPFGVFLRVCDKWETRVETKGGSVCITGLKKSSFQQQPIQKTGGQNQESITRILTNYGGDLPKSTTFQKYPWDTPILNLSLTQKVSTPNSPIRSTERLKPCTREQEKNTMPLTECSDAMSTESPEFSPNSPILYLRNQEPLDWISPIPLAQDDSIEFTTNDYQDFW